MGHYDIPMNESYPSFEEPLRRDPDPRSQLLYRVFLLLKEVFPESIRKEHVLEVVNRPIRVVTLFYVLNPKPNLRALKFAVTENATTAMLVVAKLYDTGSIGLPELESRSVEREVLANDCWDAFIGWVSYVKEIYEKELKP